MVWKLRLLGISPTTPGWRTSRHANTMTGAHQLMLMIFVGALSPSYSQYDSYEVRDEDDDSEEENPAVDYTKYFGGIGGDVGPGTPQQAADDSAGFVQPLDFTGFFGGGQFGALDGLAGGASQQVFRASGSSGQFHLPIASAGFGSNLQASASTNQSSGFTEPNVSFHSLFDTSSSPTEQGFRPQDFLQRDESQTQDTSTRSFFTPAFANLKHDVDRGVYEQKKEEGLIEQSRSASNRRPQDDYEEEEEEKPDYSEEDYEDPPRLDPNDRSPHKYTKQPYEEQNNYGRGEHLAYNTPYSQVRKTVHHTPSESRPIKPKYKKPLPTAPEAEDDYAPSFDYDSKEFNDDYVFPSEPSPQSRPVKPTHKVYHNPYTSQSHNSKPLHNTSPYPPYSPVQKPSHTNPIRNKHPYKYANPPPQKPIKVYPQRPYADFRPSPSDPYSDSIPKPYPITAYTTPRPKSISSDGLHSLPQTEFASVIPRKIVQPAAGSASGNKKRCTKIQKKVNPKDVGRFRRHQMTCYVCTNPKTGGTYEQCSYESDSKPKSFYKGSAEAFTSGSVTNPFTYHTREKRSTGNPFTIEFPKFDDLDFGRSISLTRKVRQYTEYDDSDRPYGPNTQNYRFGPEYFTPDGTEEGGGNEEKRRRSDDGGEYDEEGDEEEEEESEAEGGSDGEEEQHNAPAGEHCRKIRKKGLICMVCQNPKSSGTYEQCSYASDPEANRYEYARESTYGSGRQPESDRYKRYIDKVGNPIKKKPKKNSFRQYRHNEPDEELRRKGDYKYGKLKRKKVGKTDYAVPIEFAESVSKRNRELAQSRKTGGVGLDPFFYGDPGEPYNPDDYDAKGNKIKRKGSGESQDEEQAATATEEEEEKEPTYEEYFLKLFPELAGKDREAAGTEETEINEEDPFAHPYIPEDDDSKEDNNDDGDEEESESKHADNKVKPGFEYKADLPDYFEDDTEPKKDLERVLGEFTQKNRSDCKKVMRDKMTCYQCIDKKGMQHEECMFVAASEPKSKHLAYHEVKEFRMAPKSKKDKKGPSDEVKSQTKNQPVEINDSAKLTNPTKIEHGYKEQKEKKKRKFKPKKYYNTETTTIPISAVTDNEGQPALAYDILKINPKVPPTRNVNVSPTTTTYFQEENPSILQRRKRLHELELESAASEHQDSESKEVDGSKDAEEEVTEQENSSKKRPNYNAVPTDPPGFDEREGPEGAYSEDTEPVFDTVLQMTLPKYMLTRSEHEAIFDEVLASG